MQSQRKTVLGLGMALVDMLYHVPEEFLQSIPGRKGGTEVLSPKEMDDVLGRISSTGKIVQGGGTANSIVALSHLGEDCSLICKLCHDKYGDFFTKALQDAGVDTSKFKYSEQPTGRCLSLITPDSERTMRTCQGATRTMCPADLCEEEFPEGGAFLMESYSIFDKVLMRKAIDIAHARGMEIHLDLASPEIAATHKDYLLDVIRGKVHAVYANELEAMAISGASSPKKALDFIAELCPLAIVKLGAKGAMLKDSSGKVTRVSALDVKAVDTTAAGDLWAAGFVHGYINGWTLEDAAHFGAMTSAEVVQVTGSALPESTWEKLRSFHQ